MRPDDVKTYQDLREKISAYSNEVRYLPGIQVPVVYDCFLKQMIDSIRRIKYVTVIKDKEISAVSTDATLPTFDPLKASLWHYKNHNFDEACWLIFLAIHFGKNIDSGWNLMRNFYNKIGTDSFWEWHTITSNKEEFLSWLNNNRNAIYVTGKFGNHRKYESLNAYKRTGTGAAIMSYIDWIEYFGSHSELFENLGVENNHNPKILFNSLYKSMNCVLRFGRTAKFDYLTMIGKLGYVNLIPDSTYMSEATGPLRGARRLFQERNNPDMTKTELNNIIFEFEAHLKLYFGMQVLEDALCNWQKSPANYLYFGG